MYNAQVGTQFFHRVTEITVEIKIAVTLYVTQKSGAKTEISLFGTSDEDRKMITSVLPQAFEPIDYDTSLAFHRCEGLTITKDAVAQKVVVDIDGTKIYFFTEEE